VSELGPNGDDEALASAWFLVCAGENLRAQWEASVAAIEHVLMHAPNPGDLWRDDALEFIGPAVFWGPTPLETGLPRVEALLQDARGNKGLEAWSIRPVAGFYGMQGRFEEARELLAEARAILEDLGRRTDVVTLAFWTGTLELLAGDPVAAERDVSAAAEALEAAGEKGWLSTMATLLAEALCAQGRLDEAEAAVAKSRDATTTDDHSAQALRRAAEAKILARRGKFDEAEKLAREGVDHVNRTDELNNWGLVRESLGEVLSRAGRADDAAEALRDALDVFERKGNRVAAARVRGRLEELR
jgi:tetratricopeptide (TPR) repeat protein